MGEVPRRHRAPATAPARVRVDPIFAIGLTLRETAPRQKRPGGSLASRNKLETLCFYPQRRVLEYALSSAATGRAEDVCEVLKLALPAHFVTSLSPLVALTCERA